MASTTHKTNVPEISHLYMFFLSCLVGIVAGFGAILFRWMIAVVHNLFFYGTFNGQYNVFAHAPESTWGIFILFSPIIGAVLVTFLVKTFAPEAQGHGVPEVMNAIYHEKGKIRPIVAVIKTLASAISIGSGGSIGREGPIAQIGSAFGSMLSMFVNMPTAQRVILVAAGAGAGIAATFNAPIGGIAFSIELMLVSIAGRTLLPVGVAVVIATYISRYFLGVSPMLGHLITPEDPTIAFNVMGLPITIIFGLLCGACSILFIKGLYWMEDLFNMIPCNQYIRHMFGMLIVGLMMIAFMHYTGHYRIQGVGYATIISILDGLILNPWFLLILIVTKFLATSITLGSGASGGVFSPILFIGSALGMLFGILLNMMYPSIHINPFYFVMAGMSAMISGASGAIVTAIVMVFEITGNSNALLLMILSSVIALGVRRHYMKESVYTLKLFRRHSYLPEGMMAAMVEAKQAQHILSTDLSEEIPGKKPNAKYTLAWKNKQPHQLHIASVDQKSIQTTVNASQMRLVDKTRTLVDLLDDVRLKPGVVFVVREGNKTLGIITSEEIAIAYADDECLADR
jgi:chloride channel protein, CIC family